MQKNLSVEQLSAFYHDVFVEDQVRHFGQLLMDRGGMPSGTVVDVGGGCGYFARAIQERLGVGVRVVDSDPVSVEKCSQIGVAATQCDAMNIIPQPNERVACFNLFLHHLVSDSEKTTQKLQMAAIGRWRGDGRKVFVNEYIYESYLSNMSGWLIYQVTKSRILSKISKMVSLIVPVFRANTFGIGVRFRSHDEWKALFENEGFEVVGVVHGNEETVAFPLRLLLIKHIRRDSFLLA